MATLIDQLQIGTEDQPDGTVVLTLRGELDIESAPRLRAALERAAEAPSAIVLDLADLEFIDSSGISVLVDAQLRATREGHRLLLRNLPVQAARVLRVAGLDSTFTIQ